MAKRSNRRVFISYSSADKVAAEAVCGALEGAGVGCFLAHRDNRGGTLWDEAILDALEAAPALVLLLSRAANESPYVKREVERAASRNLPITPFRIEDVQPGRSLEFFIRVHHWLDGFPGAIEPHLNALVLAVHDQVSTRRARRDRDVDVYPYMVSRGPAAHHAFTQSVPEPKDRTIRGTETVEDLRAKLLLSAIELKQPIDITVEGTLFPCALLSSGWWERRKQSKVRNLQWRDGLQEWLFTGFDQWGPSWDFTWASSAGADERRPYVIAQLGDGDEANSLPVLLPAEKAKRLQAVLGGTWGGVQAEVKGVLGHRRHFEKDVDPKVLELFGGLLDYCLRLDEDNKEHVIRPRRERTQVYSGYIWKCVAPKELVLAGTPCLSDVYFLWEHVNFANQDACAYGVEALDQKEAQLQRRYGELLLIQKSSELVRGTPLLTTDAVYNMLLGKSDIVI